MRHTRLYTRAARSYARYRAYKGRSPVASMSIPVSCACGKDYAVPDKRAGRPMKCFVCGRELLVPGTPVESDDEGDRSAPSATRPLWEEANKPSEAPQAADFLVHCPKCRKPLKIKSQYAGRRGKCFACGAPISLPKELLPTADTRTVVRQENGSFYGPGVRGLSEMEPLVLFLLEQLPVLEEPAMRTFRAEPLWPAGSAGDVAGKFVQTMTEVGQESALTGKLHTARAIYSGVESVNFAVKLGTEGNTSAQIDYLMGNLFFYGATLFPMLVYCVLRGQDQYYADFKEAWKPSSVAAKSSCGHDGADSVCPRCHTAFCDDCLADHAKFIGELSMQMLRGLMAVGTVHVFSEGLAWCPRCATSLDLMRSVDRTVYKQGGAQ